MADVTDVLAIPFPEGGDSFSTAVIQSLAERVDEAPGIESLTSAEIAALASAQKPAGRVVWNSTTGKVQVSNGTSFVDADAAAIAAAAAAQSTANAALPKADNLAALADKAQARSNLGLGTAATTASTDYATSAQGTLATNALPKGGGTMSGAIAMGGSKVTGMAKGTANGDAMARQQIQSGYVAVDNETYATVTFATAFGDIPTVIANVNGDLGATTGRFWTSHATASSFRLYNYGGGTSGFLWIAVGN